MWDLSHALGDRAFHPKVKFRQAEGKKKERERKIDEGEVWNDGVIGQEAGRAETDQQNDGRPGEWMSLGQRESERVTAGPSTSNSAQ